MKPTDHNIPESNLQTFQCAIILIIFGIIEQYFFINMVGAKLFIGLFTINFFQLFIWAAFLEDQFNSFLQNINKKVNLLQPETSLSMITLFLCILIQKITIYSKFPLTLSIFFPLGITMNLWLDCIKELLISSPKIHTSFDQKQLQKVLNYEGQLHFFISNIVLTILTSQYSYFGYLTFNNNYFFLKSLQKQQIKIILLLYSIFVTVNLIFCESPFLYILTQIIAPFLLTKKQYLNKRGWIFNYTLITILMTKLLMQYGMQIEFPQINLFLLYIIILITIINFNVILIPEEVKIYIPIINSVLPVIHILGLFLFVYSFENESIQGYENLIVYFILIGILYNLMRFICYLGRNAQEIRTYKQKVKIQNFIGKKNSDQNIQDFYDHNMGQDKYLLHSFENQTQILQGIFLITYFCIAHDDGYATNFIFLLAIQLDKEFFPYKTLIALISSKQFLFYLIKFFHQYLINKNKLINILVFNFQKQKQNDLIAYEILCTILAFVLAWKHKCTEKILVISLPLWVYILLYTNINQLIPIFMIILCVNKLLYI